MNFDCSAAVKTLTTKSAHFVDGLFDLSDHPVSPRVAREAAGSERWVAPVVCVADPQTTPPRKRPAMAASLAALLAMTAGFGGVAANAAAPGDEPAIVYEMSAEELASLSALADETQASKPSKWLIGGAMGLILAALVKLIGANRVANMAAAAGPALRKSADVLAAAPRAAAKAVGSAVASPLRFVFLVGGLAMIGFTGVGIYNLEWAGGLAVGAGLTALTWLGSSKLKNVFRLKRASVSKR